MFIPDIANKSVLLVVRVPPNWEPSDIVTVAVESTVPTTACSGNEGTLAGESVIDIGVGPVDGGGVVA